MDEQQSFVDYYRILECDRMATDDELKRSYKRLILMSHPDKVTNESDENFLLIQKAWSVLKDPSSRKQYDAMLACHEHTEYLLYDTIALADMDFDGNERIYTYPCRCGGTYLLSASDSMPSGIVIGCDECSFSIQVNNVDNA